jgi:hypothetical protein
MFIDTIPDTIPDRKSPAAVLLRESYREGGRVKKRTLANLSKLPQVLIDGIVALLGGGKVSGKRAAEPGFEIVESDLLFPTSRGGCEPENVNRFNEIGSHMAELLSQHCLERCAQLADFACRMGFFIRHRLGLPIRYPAPLRAILVAEKAHVCRPICLCPGHGFSAAARFSPLRRSL